MNAPNRIRVVCVDDNRMLADAIAVQIASHHRLEWAGWLENVPTIVEDLRALMPDVVLMDIDMPGPDPFGTIASLGRMAPHIRVLMFSAYVRQDYIDRALEHGAWGYVSKNESMADVLDAVIKAHEGELVLTPEVLAEHHVR